MFFSRCALVVFKTTGGRSWNPPGGLKPLTPSQQRNRKKNIGITLKNLSVLKLAEANQPAVPVRLYKPLSYSRAEWMKKKLEQTRQALGWGGEAAMLGESAKAVLPALRAAREAAAAAKESGSLLPRAAQEALKQGAQR
ncbi:hypothetical protein HYH03_000208 [Edaphochlamys debaryana]|uniref:Uncharacterized protein n=1 Tax=Edaphochlamys debaryana TaxID=47281 RepID=A0A835YF22_9CHLO|nr:hypothetical protein HYH03_000208 [Edaphochlamys debaryana]|eukprot:KAG2501707.1 hypothetical protein HYH03_000208 [Edaphochlamys debaryana]